MRTRTYATCFLAASLGLSTLAIGQEPDNTKTNKRDKDKGAQQSTPQNATETKEDLQTLSNIRRAVTKDSSLSTYAQNIKIMVKNGTVTLRGPVRSAEEKSRIEEIAKANGAANVLNELEIAPPK